MENKTIKKFEELKNEKNKYMPLWREIAKYCGVRVDPNDDSHETGDALDTYALDPTASLSVVQSAEYQKGVIIGTGTNLFSIEPSDELLKSVDISSVKKWYEYATKVCLEEMNHPESGFHTAFSNYFYDECAFGTAGIGCFKNNTKDENKLIFRNYGVDTLYIDAGKNGTISTVMNKHTWRVGEFVDEFCLVDGMIDEEMYNKMPSKVRGYYESEQLNETFDVVFAITRNEKFNGAIEGKNSFRFKGEWFLEDDQEVFLTEYFKHKPIVVGRPITIRGEIYGRAYGTMLISSIRCVDEIVNGVMVTLDKMREPALGTFGGLTGDNVLDTSSGSLNVFNAETLQGQQPIFPLQDIGDPSALVQYLLPYLNEKIATAFKIDSLLDFASDSNMTATESLQRYSIRNKSLLGLVINQVNDVVLPLCDRAINLLMSMGVLGATEEDAVKALAGMGRTDAIMPVVVQEFVNTGKKWYKIRFNTEVEKIGNTDKVDNLIQLINFTSSILAIYPQLSSGIDWYALWLDVSDAYGGKKYSMDANQFKKIIEAQAKQQAQATMMQAQNLQSQTNKNQAGAMKDLGQDGL